MDVNENKAPDKRRSSEKIDDMTALLMAIGTAIAEEQSAPQYRVFFV
jgi:phage terminase large subunit-like protein